ELKSPCAQAGQGRGAGSRARDEHQPGRLEGAVGTRPLPAAPLPRHCWVRPCWQRGGSGAWRYQVHCGRCRFWKGTVL
ncbi:unnamed protein product, partial [Closterium sp. NIES-54]